MLHLVFDVALIILVSGIGRKTSTRSVSGYGDNVARRRNFSTPFAPLCEIQSILRRFLMQDAEVGAEERGAEFLCGLCERHGNAARAHFPKCARNAYPSPCSCAARISGVGVQALACPPIP